MSVPINPDDFSWSKFSRLLGQSIDAPQCQEILIRNRLDLYGIWKPVLIGLESTLRTAVVDTQKIDLREAAGVKLECEHARMLAGLEDLGTKFVFSGVTYFAEGESGASQFRGDMPYGIVFADTDSSVVAKVSRPVRETHKTTDGTYFSFGWGCDTYNLHTVFLSATRRLCRVTCYLPPSPNLT